MKRAILTLVAAVALGAPAASADSRIVLESAEKKYAAASLEALSLDFPVGKLHIEGTDGNEITVKLLVHCKRSEWKCEEMADQVALDARTRGSRIDIDVQGHSLFDTDDFWVEGELRVPRRMRINVEMPVGEVEISGMASDVDLRVKVGEVTLDLPEDAISRVEAGVTIGEASLHNSEGRQQVEGLFANKLRWLEGRGRARVNVELGIGELSMRLY